MNPLARVQDDFQSFMLRAAADIERHVVGTERVPVATRLAIYGDGYASRLIEALEANYPALAKLLGPEDFVALGEEYVRAHESTFTSIRYYGAALADFLAAHTEYAVIPVLPELARWEWSMTEVFDAADTDSIGVDALAQIAPQQWAGLSFDFHPSLRRLALHWNVPPLWKAITDEAKRPEFAVTESPTEWLLWRQELRTFFRSLTLAEAQALDAARRGENFGTICGVLTEHFSETETPARAAGFLRGWVESGVIVGACDDDRA